MYSFDEVQAYDPEIAKAIMLETGSGYGCYGKSADE